MSRAGLTTRDRDGDPGRAGRFSRRRTRRKRAHGGPTGADERRPAGTRSRDARLPGRGGARAARAPRAGRSGRIGRAARYRRPLLAVVGLLLVAAFGVALWAGPFLPLRSVRVDGLTTLSADVVREAAGVGEGTPLPRVDVDAAEAGVARLPQVASVEVTRGWPDSVVVTVVERTPVAVADVDGRPTLLDRHGVPYDTITGAPPAGVVPLEVAEPGPDDPATAAALAAITALPADLRASLVGARAESADDVTLVLDEDTTVRWGDADRAADKAAVLVALLRQVAAGTLEPAAELDVGEPDAVVLR